MAKGVTKSSTWKPGDPRASLAGKKSSRALPPELKEARLMNANKVEETLYKYMSSPLETLQAVMKDPTTPAMDLVVIKILTEAIRTGDHNRLDFLLTRTIGKSIDRIQVDARVQTKTLHEQILDIIEVENENK